MELTDMSVADAATHITNVIMDVLNKLPRAKRVERLHAIDRAIQKYTKETN